MDRSPLVLAALASAAVPGLDPATVESLPSLPGDRFDVAIVRDTEHRLWVVRAPRTETAAAALDGAVALLALLTRRLSLTVPAPKGSIGLATGGRAWVHPYIPGHPLEFAQLPEGPGLASELGRTLAAVHNLDPRLYDEAGLPSYDADDYRTRRLADLDRAASTGRIPLGLLSRWERALENVSLWRFATTPTHGSFTGGHVLAVFDRDEVDSGRVRGLLAWEDANVSDPAEDFAALVHESSPAAVESVMESYAHSRVERPDPHLLVRARLLGELSVVRDLMVAIHGGDLAAADALTGRLRRLDDHVHSLEGSSDDYRRMSLTPQSPNPGPNGPLSGEVATAGLPAPESEEDQAGSTVQTGPAHPDPGAPDVGDHQSSAVNQTRRQATVVLPQRVHSARSDNDPGTTDSGLYSAVTAPIPVSDADEDPATGPRAEGEPSGTPGTSGEPSPGSDDQDHPSATAPPISSVDLPLRRDLRRSRRGR